MSSLPWLWHASDAFPEIQFLLVSPEPSTELQSEGTGRTSVLLDQEGRLGGAFRIDQVPEVSFLVEGVIVKDVQWPFTEGDLLRACAESLLIDIQRPDPSTMLGERAPAIEAVGLDDEQVSVAELPKPYLVVFFRIGCSTCWESLASLNELCEEVPVVLVVMSPSENGISDSDRRRLMQLHQAATSGQVSILVATGVNTLQDYQLATSPTYCLVDAEGMIAGIWEGQLDTAVLAEKLRALTEEAE